MDALRESALNFSICQDLNFGKDRKRKPEERTKFNIISVFALENGEVDVDPRNIQRLSEKQFTKCFPQDENGNLELPPLRQTEEWHQRLADTVRGHPGLLSSKPPGTTATLNVIYVDNENDSVRGMSRHTLLTLFDIFELDFSSLHLLRRGADSWHCIRRDDDTCAFLLIIQSLYRMACSFSPNGRETNCVIFGSPPKGIENEVDKTNFNFYQPAWFCEQPPSSDEFFDDQSMLDEQKTFEPSHALPKLLEKIQSHHLHHPLSLAYLGLVDSLSSIFIRVGKEVGPIGELEDALDEATEPISDNRKTLDSLVSLSEKAGTASVTMARLSKVTGVASMLLQTLEDSKDWKRWCQRFFPTSPGSQYSQAAEWLAEGLPSCRQILQNEKLQIQSQDDRVKALTPIIFALISRSDAQSGLTIAVMTMTFLPATSIAAIMAVPWDRGGQGVRALQAIVYSVVTVFMTVAVFLFWMSGATWFTRAATWFKRAARDAKLSMSISIRPKKASRSTGV